jgi:hypothetical protein
MSSNIFYKIQAWFIYRILYSHYTEISLLTLLYPLSSFFALFYFEKKHSAKTIFVISLFSMLLAILCLTEFKCLHSRDTGLSNNLFHVFANYVFVYFPKTLQQNNEIYISGVLGFCRELGVWSTFILIAIVLTITFCFYLAYKDPSNKKNNPEIKLTTNNNDKDNHTKKMNFFKRVFYYLSEERFHFVHVYAFVIVALILLITVGKFTGFVYVGFDTLPVIVFRFLKTFLVYLQKEVFNIPLRVDVPVNEHFVENFSNFFAYCGVFIGCVLCTWFILILSGLYFEKYPRYRFDKPDKEEKQILQKYEEAISEKVKRAYPKPAFKGAYVRLVYDLIPSKKYRKKFLERVTPKEPKLLNTLILYFCLLYLIFLAYFL